MATAAFGQTVLSVTKFDECVRFYRDLLGCDVVGGDPSGPVVHFGSGGQRFGLVDRKALPPELAHSDTAPPGSLPATLAFFSDDVDAMHEKLSKAGIRYTITPRDFPEWGVRSSVCHDPDGNPVEIARRLAAQTTVG